MVSVRAVANSEGTIKQNIKSNIKVIVYAEGRLEQYTRRDKFSCLVVVKETDSNIIHHLPSRSPNKPVIVWSNNRHIRHQIQAKKAVLNTGSMF